VVVPWFAAKGIDLKLEEVTPAKEGAYDYALHNCGFTGYPCF
jgi:hypothetical protein